MSTSIFSESWCGIIFDGRNQQYGAYELRKSNERNTILAILFSISFLSVGINIILLKSDPQRNFIPIIEKKEAEDAGHVLEDIPLLPDIPMDEPEAAQTQSEPEPTPVFAATEAITTIKIVDDHSAVDTVPSQESFGEKQAGATTQEGDSTLTASIERVETSGQGSGQSTPVIDWAEVMPQFPGGEEALLDYIRKNTVYPDIAVRNDIEGTVHIQFVVDRDGSLTDVRLARKIFKCLDDEALRVVKSMPNWKPGKQNGETVRVRFAVPIRFVLD